MAKLHVATLSPSKLELLSGWAQTRPELAVHASSLEVLGAYRFDDPAGEVGIETHVLAAADGSVLHLPVTYRSEPATELEAHAIGTLEHSVLGTRWVYDGCADPIYVSELIRTILTGGEQVELVIHADDGQVIREPNALVRGTGEPGTPVPAVDTLEVESHPTSCTITSGTMSVRVARIVDPAATANGAALLGTWSGQDEPAVVAELA